jgi:hypothetical protein
MRLASEAPTSGNGTNGDRGHLFAELDVASESETVGKTRASQEGKHQFFVTQERWCVKSNVDRNVSPRTKNANAYVPCSYRGSVVNRRPPLIALQLCQ